MTSKNSLLHNHPSELPLRDFGRFAHGRDLIDRRIQSDLDASHAPYKDPACGTCRQLRVHAPGGRQRIHPGLHGDDPAVVDVAKVNQAGHVERQGVLTCTTVHLQEGQIADGYSVIPASGLECVHAAIADERVIATGADHDITTRCAGLRVGG